MRPAYNDLDDETLLALLKEDDNKSVMAFEVLYDRYVQILYRYIDSRIRNGEDSREQVQGFFEWLWSSRKTLPETISVKNYFFGAARHRVLKYFRSERVQEKYLDYFDSFVKRYSSSTTEEILDVKDLEASIERSIATLPHKCREAFRMSRFEHLATKDIAERLNISTRTVENLISQALKQLRTDLGQMFILVLLFYVIE